MTTIADNLADSIAKRGWRQADCARVLAWPVQTLSDVLNRKRSITASMALDLEKLTGKSATAWMVQQAMEDLAVASADADAEAKRAAIPRRASLEDVVPVRELARRGVLDDSSDEAHQIDQVLELLEVNRLGEKPAFATRVAAKRSNATYRLSRLQVAWIALARRRAAQVAVEPYDEHAFSRLAASVPHRVRDDTALASLQKKFSQVGVRLVYVPGLPGAKIDGVSLEYRSSPMIAVSGRGKRLDKVMFALLHECAHVALGHWQNGALVLHDSEHLGDERLERDANQLAEMWTLPRGVGTDTTFNQAAVTRIARLNDVAEVMVIGQLQHQEKIPWASVLARGLPSAEEALNAWQ